MMEGETSGAVPARPDSSQGTGQVPAINPADLRGILHYVPQFRRKIIVLGISGALVEHENFHNLLLDVAVLRSLNIHVVVICGIGQLLEKRAAGRGITLSDITGEGVTDAPTLEAAEDAAAEAARRMMAGLTRAGLKSAWPNAVRGVQRGIIDGRDHLYTARLDSLDTQLIRELLDREIVPLFPGLCWSREGQPLRISADVLAAEAAQRLDSHKLIYLVDRPGLIVDGAFHMNEPVETVAAILRERAESIDEAVRRKVHWAVRAIEGGVPRSHLIDGRLRDGLLTELFSKVGIGTMIHGNEYQQIRPARLEDLPGIESILRSGARDAMLRTRDRREIGDSIGDFFVYEVDGSLIGCASLVCLDASRRYWELAGVFVQPFYQKKGVGARLVAYAEEQARQRGARELFALTTQNRGFFRDGCGFEEVSASELPEPRRSQLQSSGRNSIVLRKFLA